MLRGNLKNIDQVRVRFILIGTELIYWTLRKGKNFQLDQLAAAICKVQALL